MNSAGAVVVIDSGTTNSRVRLLREGTVIGAASVQVGVVDTTKTGSNAALKQGVRQAFDQALRDGEVSVGEIPYALGFGMITSELGVVEIPHLVAPVGIQDLSVDVEGRIIGSVTTLSGQLFAALCKETFIGSAVREAATDPEPAGYFDAGIVEEGHRIVTNGGLTRSLLMPRFMHVLMLTRWYERKLFLESLIAADDLQSVRDFTALGFPTGTTVYLVGPAARCAVHRHLIARHRIFRGPVVELSEPETMDRLGPAGALEIFRHRTA